MCHDAEPQSAGGSALTGWLLREAVTRTREFPDMAALRVPSLMGQAKAEKTQG